MALNIKNEGTCELIQQLAQLTGESMTQAVNNAVQEKVDRLHRKKNFDVEKLLEIGRDCAAHMTEPWKSGDIDDLLYDEKGLPK